MSTIGAEWSYPLARSEGGVHQVLEPIVQLISSPNVGNTVEIPNEDSLSFEFDDTNLFSEDRFAGLDRWETGTRANVGLRYSVYTPSGAQANALFGQSYRLEENTSVAAETGLRDETSDYVGRIMVSPSNNLLAVYRFRIDDERFKIRRNEVNLLGRHGPVSAELGYGYYAADQSVTFQEREEVYLGSVVKLDEYWRLFGQTRQDLADHRTVANRVGIGYEDECLDASLMFSQSFYRDRDYEPDSSVMFQVTFKTLGTGSPAGARGFE